MEDIKTKFFEFNENNPHVYEWFKKFALKGCKRAQERNWKYISADMIAHRVRWEANFAGNAKEEFKLNNNYVAYYSRMFQDEFPQYENLFRNRKVRYENS